MQMQASYLVWILTFGGREEDRRIFSAKNTYDHIPMEHYKKQKRKEKKKQDKTKETLHETLEQNFKKKESSVVVVIY